MESDRLRLAAKELQLAHSTRDPVLFHGRSMLPFLRDGDRLVVAPVRWEAIRPGDIVTYRFEEKFPTRRVVALLPDRLQLRADSWPGLEYEVRPAELLGRVVARGRGGRVITSSAWRWRLWARLIVTRYRARRTLSPLRHWWRQRGARPSAAAGGADSVA